MKRARPKKRRRRLDSCLRHCVARLTGRDVRRVPHFVRKYKGHWHQALCRWCDRNGYVMLMYPLASKRRYLSIVSEGCRRWINIGETKSGSSHAVLLEAEPGQPGRVTFDSGHPLRKTIASLFIFKKRGML